MKGKGAAPKGAEIAPEAVVQRQLDAYNARDLEALLSVYVPEAQLFEHPANLLASGRAALRERFAARFLEPNLHALLLRRIVLGGTVIDCERVTRTFAEGPGELELVMIYEVKGAHISRAWTIAGTKKIFTDRSPAESESVSRAAVLAQRAHHGQFRRDGTTPHLAHCASVVAQVAGDPVAEAVAWLHDVIEDTPFTAKRLREEKIPEAIVVRVELLTNPGGTGYERYLARIKSDPVAKKVKVADLLANLNDRPSERQKAKIAKSLLALVG